MRRSVIGLLLAALVATGLIAATAAADAPRLRLRALSARADAVSGGDVLVGVTGVTKGRVRLSLRGTRVGTKVRGGWLVDGLRRGNNTIVATNDGRDAKLTVVNHPSAGPIFSGPRLPLLCTEADPPPPAGTRARRRATCATKRTVEYRYWSTRTNRYETIPDAQAPTDAATVEIGGREYPEVVRYETGTVNRSPYFFASLVDGWNRRLVYQFGGGCNVTYSQGSQLGTNVLDHALLAKGYAIATANFNTFQTSCSDVVSAETATMVKERFSEAVGLPEFTIGTGPSGGAIQQLLVAQNYPGILDALSPIIPFPDAISIAPGVSDCGLLERYYASATGSALVESQRIAINGHASTRTCQQWVALFLNTIDPKVGCDPRIPAEQIYSDTNPRGIRCTLQDFNRNQFGIDPRTGFARRPLDNVGVAYGLAALKDGAISVDEFLDLNEQIGGFDIDGNIVGQRERSTRAEIERAYATGRVLTGGGTITELPIIMVNLYSDQFGDIHDRLRLFTIQDRLSTDDQDDPNVAIWTVPSDGDLAAALTGAAFDPTEIIELLDEWLTTGEQPEAAGNRCTLPEGTVETGDEVYESGPCADAYPVAGDPRTAAGAPVINDILKCARRSAAPPKGVPFDAAQTRRLRRIFPAGMCDWEEPGIGQARLARTWIDYGTGPFATR